MRGMIERVGPCRIEYGEPVFHSLAEAIVYQQLNGKAAETIFKRFTARSGAPITPQGILKLTPDEMRSVGLSKQKSAYLIDMAERAHRGVLDFSRLPEMSDEEVIEHLTQVKGVGVWTAHMFLMFTLRRPNILPVGDFGVRMAMHRYYLARRARHGAAKNGAGKPKGKAKKVEIKLPTPAQMEKIAKRWEPYRSIACWYLWQSLDIKTIA